MTAGLAAPRVSGAPDLVPEDLRDAHDDDGKAFLGFAAAVLRWRRLIVGLGMAGGLIGLASGLLSTRLYRSNALFVPQSSDAGLSGLALAASQLGVRVPAGSGGPSWGTGLYVEVLRSRALLEPITRDSFTVTEMGGRRIPFMELFEIRGASAEARLDRGVRALQGAIKATDERTIGAVRLSVNTPWPSVSLTLAERVLLAVDEFNTQRRRSQAAAERVFVERQTAEAEEGLRDVENRLRVFREQNRTINGPRNELEHQRLQREVNLRQSLYTSLLQNREEARIREVRDTPVITVLEEPRLPIDGESRGTVLRALLGGFAGGMLALLIALVADAMQKARQTRSTESREFFRLWDETVPRFLRRGQS
jgi:hypothetical protein